MNPAHGEAFCCACLYREQVWLMVPSAARATMISGKPAQPDEQPSMLLRNRHHEAAGTFHEHRSWRAAMQANAVAMFPG